MVKPLVGCHPKITIGSELSDHRLNLAVISIVRIEQYFPRVELLGILMQSCQVLVYLHTRVCNSLIVLDVLPRVKVLNGPFQVVDLLLELLL